jgi:hypothetical protein
MSRLVVHAGMSKRAASYPHLANQEGGAMSLNSPIPTVTFALAVGVQAQTPPHRPSIPGDLSAGNLCCPAQLSVADNAGSRGSRTCGQVPAPARARSRAIDEACQKIMQCSAPPPER